jgi:hypothetical protein
MIIEPYIHDTAAHRDDHAEIPRIWFIFHPRRWSLGPWPELLHGVLLCQWSGEEVAQTPAAPEAILVDRFESQWIQKYLIPGRSLRCHAHVRSIAAVYSPRRAARLHLAR